MLLATRNGVINFSRSSQMGIGNSNVFLLAPTAEGDKFIYDSITTDDPHLSQVILITPETVLAEMLSLSRLRKSQLTRYRDIYAIIDNDRKVQSSGNSWSCVARKVGLLGVTPNRALLSAYEEMRYGAERRLVEKQILTVILDRIDMLPGGLNDETLYSIESILRESRKANASVIVRLTGAFEEADKWHARFASYCRNHVVFDLNDSFMKEAIRSSNDCVRLPPKPDDNAYVQIELPGLKVSGFARYLGNSNPVYFTANVVSQ